MSDNMLSRLGDVLGNIIQRAAVGTLKEKYSGRIADDQIFRREADHLAPAPINGEFKPNQSYLQVLVNHMYVSQDRRLWVGREHLGAVWMGFRYAGAMQSVPFMLGRDLLIDKVQQLPQGAHIEFRDVRVGRTYPYTGDSVALYVGLWSTPTIDWATSVFSALDTIAGKVKVAASLRQVLDMVDVLNQGISTILGLNAIEARLNLYQEFQDPTVGELGLLQPGYYVMIDAPTAGVDPSKLRVIDGRLHAVHAANEQPTPYYDHDFLLYSITSLPLLSTAVDMFGQQYDSVLAALIGSKANANRLAAAAQEYHTLQTQIVTSSDITRADKNRLIAFFNDSLNQDAIRLAVNLKDGNVAFGMDLPSQLPADVRRPTQMEYEAHSVRLDPTLISADPTVTAGAAAGHFSSILGGVAEA